MSRWPRNAWLQRDIDRAIELRRKGASYQEIADALRTNYRRVNAKLSSLAKRDQSIPREPTGRPHHYLRPPPSVTQARERRAAAETLRSTTQAVFGDPPPGYSALDQKRLRAIK